MTSRGKCQHVQTHTRLHSNYKLTRDRVENESRTQVRTFRPPCPVRVAERALGKQMLPERFISRMFICKLARINVDPWVSVVNLVVVIDLNPIKHLVVFICRGRDRCFRWVLSDFAHIFDFRLAIREHSRQVKDTFLNRMMSEWERNKLTFTS